MKPRNYIYCKYCRNIYIYTETFSQSTILICLNIGDPVRVVLVMYVQYDFILASEVRLFLDIGESWHGVKSWHGDSPTFFLGGLILIVFQVIILLGGLVLIDILPFRLIVIFFRGFLFWPGNCILGYISQIYFLLG